MAKMNMKNFWEKVKIKFIPHIEAFEPIALPNKKSANTRKVVNAQFINPNPRNPQAPLKISISHQRKNKDGTFEDCKNYSLSQLPAGKELRMILDTEQTLALQEILNKLYEYCEKNFNIINFQSPKFSLHKDKEVMKIPSNRKKAIERLIEGNYGEDFWKELEKTKPDEATKFSFSRIYSIRMEALKEFKNHLDSCDWSEKEWQLFFEENTWIFGYGLTFKWIKPIGKKFEETTTGASVSTKGKRPDAFAKVSAEIATTVFVDIKKPNTHLLSKEYRPDVYIPSEEVVGGIAQIQTTINKWVANNDPRKILKDTKGYEKGSLYSFRPKGILIVGNLSQFKSNGRENEAMIGSFELLRRNTHNPEVITFDELYNRAKNIISNLGET